VGSTRSRFPALLARLARSTKRFPHSGAGEKGAYGIRTRATAVRGRRPRPLDECAVGRQRSRFRRPGASKRQRPGRRPLSALAVRRTFGSFARWADCDHARMKFQPLWRNPATEGGPAPCGPNAGPPIVPESSAVLPSLGESRRVSGTFAPMLISYEDEGRKWPSSRNTLSQSLENDQGRLTARARRRRLGSDPRGAPTFCGRRGPPSCSARVPFCLIENRNRERNREAERGGEAHCLPAAEVGLGDHRLGKHRKDRAARKGENESDGSRRGVSEERVSE
jgi:hypothetical protein